MKKYSFLLIVIFQCLSSWHFTVLADQKNLNSKSDNTLKTQEKLKSKCEVMLEKFSSNKKVLEQMMSGLKTLLGEGSSLEVPVNVIFQVDLQNDEQIELRKNEILGLVKNRSELSDFNSEELIKCSKSTLDQVKLNQVIEFEVEFLKNKFDFLSLEREQRNSLIASYESRRDSNRGQKELEIELNKSQKALESAKEALNQSEKESANKIESEQELIVVARASLEKYLIDLEGEHIAFIENLKKKKEDLDSLQNQIVQFSRQSTELIAETVSSNYEKVTQVWELSADGLLELFSDIELQSRLEIPDKLNASPDSDLAKKIYQQYLDKYGLIRQRQLQLVQMRGDFLVDLKARNFKLLRDSGDIRSRILAHCDSIDCDRPRGIKEKNLQNIIREIRIVPLRFIAAGLSKWLEVRSKINLGIDGWTDLIKQAFFLLCFFSVPFGLLKGLRWAASRLDEYRKQLLSRSLIDYRKRTTIAIWIARLNPFITLVGMIISLLVAGSILKKTDLRELSVFVFYLEVYYIYRAAKLLLKMALNEFFSTGTVEISFAQKKKIEKLASKISGIIFVEYLLLHVTQDTVRKALAYNVFASFIFYINIFLIFYESRKWQEEILNSFSFRFPKVWEKTANFFKMTLSKFLYPLMFFAVVLHDIIIFFISYLSKFDFFKRLLSEVLRKRLERNEKDIKDKTPPSSEYLESFDYYLAAQDEIFIAREDSLINQVNTCIDGWMFKNTSDDLAIIVGNRGMGKTTIIDHIHRKLESKVRSVYQKVPLRTIYEVQFFQWISSLLSAEIKSIQDFITFENNLDEKIVLCVDDLQNLFLGTIGGLHVYKIFLEIISLRTRHLFWCLSINSHSWAYLNGILGKEHCYGKVFVISPWKDFEIQRLIRSRHESTGYEITFDDSIKAYGAGDGVSSQVESQFFRLLWGQSRGNPRSALMYWISAITLPRTKHIHVGVPSFVNSNLVATMSDQSLIILAAIARHESLTHEELQQVTSIENTIIRKCLKEAEDKNLIWLDSDSRVRISSKAQYVIDYFLIGKNFLYE